MREARQWDESLAEREEGNVLTRDMRCASGVQHSNRRENCKRQHCHVLVKQVWEIMSDPDDLLQWDEIPMDLSVSREKVKRGDDEWEIAKTEQKRYFEEGKPTGWEISMENYSMMEHIRVTRGNLMGPIGGSPCTRERNERRYRQKRREARMITKLVESPTRICLNNEMNILDMILPKLFSLRKGTTEYARLHESIGYLLRKTYFTQPEHYLEGTNSAKELPSCETLKGWEEPKVGPGKGDPQCSGLEQTAPKNETAC